MVVNYMPLNCSKLQWGDIFGVKYPFKMMQEIIYYVGFLFYFLQEQNTDRHQTTVEMNSLNLSEVKQTFILFLHFLCLTCSQ